MFEAFVRADRDFNPSVVVFRGMLRPLVYRFHEAFHQAKHGVPEPLHNLERSMFEALGEKNQPNHDGHTT